MLGELVPVSEVEARFREIGVRVRERLEVLPDRLADQFAGETSSVVIHESLAGEIRAALEELTGG